jgi:hypothetical protein
MEVSYEINGVSVTHQQLASLGKLLDNWKVHWSTIHKLPAEDCIMVVVEGKETGNTMTMGIETDGYTHS